MQHGRPTLLVALCFAFFFAGCPQRTPEELLQATRAQYETSVISFRIEQTPVEVEAVEDDEGESTVALDPQVTTDVVLEVLVGTEAEDTLAGLTVDCEHVDRDLNVKEVRRMWLDAAGVAKGSSTQITLRMPGVDYAEGDGFQVTVRSPIPASEMADYREFDGLAGS